MRSERGDPSRDFSFTEGDPTYRIEQRLGLIRVRSPQIVRTAMIAIGATWIPLFALPAVQGNAVGHGIAVPFCVISPFTRGSS